VSSIASFPTPAVAASSSAGPVHQKALTPFESNSRQFGPVAASAIGAASAGYSFSSEGLKRLQNAIGDITDTAQAFWDGTTSVVGHLVDEVEDGMSASADSISSTYHDLKDSVERAYQYGQDIEEAVTSAVGEVVDEAVDYVALGIAAFK